MGRVLGIDHGTVRIGLALSDEMEIVASPLRTLDAARHPEREIAEIVAARRVSKIVVGMPLHMNGSHGEAARRVEDFITRLGKELRHEVPIETVDERLSSVEAEASLDRSGVTDPRQRRQVVDQLAAVIILQEHLNRSHPALLPPDEF
jgi:putative Holliday junction resolvase